MWKTRKRSVCVKNVLLFTVMPGNPVRCLIQFNKTESHVFVNGSYILHECILLSSKKE